MLEPLNKVLDQLKGCWRYRWQALIVMWAMVLLGWLFVYSLPNIYQARARVFVDTESVLRPLLTGLAVGTDVISQVNMMSRVLLARPNLEKVAKDTDLALRAETPEQFEQLLVRLNRDIRLEGGGRDSMFTITYTDSDRQMAERVVQTLVNTFVESTLGMNRTDTDNAQRFIGEQIAEYEQRLREAEELRAEFKRKNVGLMPGEGGDYYTRLQNAMAELTASRQQYNQLNSKREELLRQLEGEEPTFGLVTPSGEIAGGNPLDSKIAEYRKRLDALLLQFTDKHPEVVALRDTISQLEEQRAKEAALRGPRSPAGGSGINPLNINPVYQSMKIALSSTEVELVQLRGKLGAQQAEVNRLQGLVNTLPEVEAQLQALNRDYEVNDARHKELLQRLQSARLSEQAEESKEDIKFRIIEPPSVPLKPAGPNRPMLLTAVLFASVVLGGAFAFVLHQLNPVFLTRAALREFTGLPVLGSVSYVAPTSAGLLSDPRLQAAAAFGGLVIFYIAAVLLVGTLAPLGGS